MMVTLLKARDLLLDPEFKEEIITDCSPLFHCWCYQFQDLGKAVLDDFGTSFNKFLNKYGAIMVTHTPIRK